MSITPNLDDVFAKLERERDDMAKRYISAQLKATELGVYAGLQTQALGQITKGAIYAVNGGHACRHCSTFWHADPVVTKWQTEHHMNGCAYVIARDALAKNPNPAGHRTAEASGARSCAPEAPGLTAEASGPVGLGPLALLREIVSCWLATGAVNPILLERAKLETTRTEIGILCPDCGGIGTRMVPFTVDDADACPTCNGLGELPPRSSDPKDTAPAPPCPDCQPMPVLAVVRPQNDPLRLAATRLVCEVRDRNFGRMPDPVWKAMIAVETALFDDRVSVPSQDPGFATVPIVPTQDMMEAGYRAVGDSHYSPTAEALQGWGNLAIHVYRAMLDAAPD